MTDWGANDLDGQLPPGAPRKVSGDRLALADRSGEAPADLTTRVGSSTFPTR